MSNSLQPQGLWGHQDLLSMKVDCHSLLQEIFPTQGLNLSLLHCRWILYHLSHKGSPKMFLVRSEIATSNLIANLLSQEALWCWLNCSNSVARSTTQMCAELQSKRPQSAWYWMLGAGALGWPREMVWGRRWEGGSGLGTWVHPWKILVDVWQN